MPIYDYRCTRCGLEVEVTHAIGASGPATCDSCGGPMKKALTAPAIHFKGSGWAKKDARSAASAAKAGTSAGGDEAGSATGDTAASPKSKSGTSTTPGEKPIGGAADATGQKKPGAAPKSA